ncbi:unnamed protein product [Clavelina lepadiformis]|uniref:RWD domain-containing protein n=1 Tax=Clavelina lepadiformis TaxID=159417 RepID=A0ABP0G3N7_CLALP
MEEDREEQNNELLALESILDAAQFKYERDNGFMKVDLILNDSQIELRSPDSATSSADVNRHFVEYLPPFTLSFTLPPDYPSTNPPTFTLSCSWLPRQQLYRLCLKLDEIWSNDRGSVVLYQWYDFLQNQALEHLSIKSCLEICSDRKVHLTLMCDDEEIDSNILQRAVQDIQSESEILPLLLTYNQNQLKKVFDSSLYSCEICLESKLGAQCVEIKGCKHVYCKDCLSSYFNVNISEGNVKGLNCPEPSLRNTTIAKPNTGISKSRIIRSL